MKGNRHPGPGNTESHITSIQRGPHQDTLKIKWQKLKIKRES